MFLTYFSTCPAMMFLCQQVVNEPVNSHPIGVIVILHVINTPLKSLPVLLTRSRCIETEFT